MQGKRFILNSGGHVRWANGQDVLYPQAYLWFVFLSSLDVMLTWCILALGGNELNPLARLVIDYGDLYGLVAYKFVLVSLVLLICEFVGMRRPTIGYTVAVFAVVITALPVVISLTLFPVAIFAY